MRRGTAETAFYFPATFSVSSSINLVSCSKSVIFSPFRSSSSAYSVPSVILDTYISIGLRVTMPFPRGRKSLPIIPSRTELFPEDYDPMTTIEGSLNSLERLVLFKMLFKQKQGVK